MTNKLPRKSTTKRKEENKNSNNNIYYNNININNNNIDIKKATSRFTTRITIMTTLSKRTRGRIKPAGTTPPTTRTRITTTKITIPLPKTTRKPK